MELFVFKNKGTLAPDIKKGSLCTLSINVMYCILDAKRNVVPQCFTYDKKKPALQFSLKRRSFVELELLEIRA